MSTHHYCINRYAYYISIGAAFNTTWNMQIVTKTNKFSSASYWIHNCKAIINYWRGIWLKNKINHTVHTTIFLLQSKSLKCIHTSMFALSRMLVSQEFYIRMKNLSWCPVISFRIVFLQNGASNHNTLFKKTNDTHSGYLEFLQLLAWQ